MVATEEENGGGADKFGPKAGPKIYDRPPVARPSLIHALIVIFLEFFAWGLLTSPVITVLNRTFPDDTFLMNGLITGLKGLLSFLSAPLIGALSDVYGRKPLLLVTVMFTCAPIPLMYLNVWWYFAMVSISGIFAVTFSVVFAYVADITEPGDRPRAYGIVSASFAASLVISPSMGALIEQSFSEAVVIWFATAVSVLDIMYIMAVVPESLNSHLPAYQPSHSRNTMSTNVSTSPKADKSDDQSVVEQKSSKVKRITLAEVDPFASLRRIAKDKTILLLCIVVFLSYLPEAGQYSCFFFYLRLVMHFSQMSLALFIAMVGILSVLAQTYLLAVLQRRYGAKQTIMIGMFFGSTQLMWYGLGSQFWMMWAAGILSAISSISYPAISSLVSIMADDDKQGLVQGIITGVRGLCTGLGPALFGMLFWMFDVDISDLNGNEQTAKTVEPVPDPADSIDDASWFSLANISVPGPPFVIGSLLVLIAMLITSTISDDSGKAESGQAEKTSFRSDVQLVDSLNESAIVMTSLDKDEGQSMGSQVNEENVVFQLAVEDSQVCQHRTPSM